MIYPKYICTQEGLSHRFLVEPPAKLSEANKGGMPHDYYGHKGFDKEGSFHWLHNKPFLCWIKLRWGFFLSAYYFE